jgi:hypothetical protein
LTRTGSLAEDRRAAPRRHPRGIRAVPNRHRLTVPLAFAGALLVTVASAQAPSAAVPNPTPQETPMTQHARGAFDVKLNPLTVEHKDADERRGRMALDKRFHGDLDATGVGEMLTATGDVKGSAGYVAIERVSGTLHGRSGSFILQHSGTLTRGAPSLSITVVPDSGEGELTGIEGRMTITIVDGAHSYEFEYRLPASP